MSLLSVRAVHDEAPSFFLRRRKKERPPSTSSGRTGLGCDSDVTLAALARPDHPRADRQGVSVRGAREQAVGLERAGQVPCAGRGSSEGKEATDRKSVG